MTGRTSVAVLIVLGVLLAVGGAAAVASREGTGVAPRGSAPALPAAGEGGSTVELSADADRHPAGEAVREQLQRHFDAINARDYAQWSETVAVERSEALPESEWQEAYASTRDGTIRIDRIDEAPAGGVLVRVRFVSTQALEDAPPDVQAGRICWRSTLPMGGRPPRIGLTQDGSSTATPCP